MDRGNLADATVRAIALCVLAREGFPMRPSQQRLVSAGNLIRPLVDERIELINVPIARHGGWRSSQGKARKFIKLFAEENLNQVDAVLIRNPIVAIRIAEILEIDYAPIIGVGMPPQSNPTSILRAAKEIASDLESRSLGIVRLVLNPSEEDSDGVAVFFALLVAYLYKNDTLSAFQGGLTHRYKVLADLVPTRQPVGAVRESEDVEDFIRNWLPYALFYHAITQRPVDLVIESLIEAKLILQSGSPLLPDSVEAELARVLTLVGESSATTIASAHQQSSASDPSQEDVGDMAAVSSIMDRIYNWMGPPPTPISSHPEPSMSSPGSTG